MPYPIQREMFHKQAIRFRAALDETFPRLPFSGLSLFKLCCAHSSFANPSGGGGGILRLRLRNTHADGVVGLLEDVLDVLLRLQPVRLVHVALFSAPLHLLLSHLFVFFDFGRLCRTTVLLSDDEKANGIVCHLVRWSTCCTSSGPAVGLIDVVGRSSSHTRVVGMSSDVLDAY